MEKKYLSGNKIVNRIDLELESRRSIFSGSNEKSVVVFKRKWKKNFLNT